MIRRRVLIEYVVDHEAHTGHVDEDDKAFTIEAATQRFVDPRSAASLVRKGVAMLVDEKPVADAAPDVADETPPESDEGAD